MEVEEEAIGSGRDDENTGAVRIELASHAKYSRAFRAFMLTNHIFLTYASSRLLIPCKHHCKVFVIFKCH